MLSRQRKQVSSARSIVSTDHHRERVANECGPVAVCSVLYANHHRPRRACSARNAPTTSMQATIHHQKMYCIIVAGASSIFGTLLSRILACSCAGAQVGEYPLLGVWLHAAWLGIVP